MAWARLDSRFFDHPQVVGLSSRAQLLYVSALCLSARHHSDGFIAAEAIHAPALRGTRKQARELCAMGLWEATDGGWTFHVSFRTGAAIYVGTDSYALGVIPARDNWEKMRSTKRIRARLKRDVIIARDGMVCGICGDEVASVGDIDIDHIMPVSRGGLTIPENLRVSHSWCNRRRGNRI